MTTTNEGESQRSSAAKFNDVRAVRQAVEGNESCLSMEMSELRGAFGAQRLGRNVLSRMSKALAGEGLGHYPPDLPNDQTRVVRVFKLGSPVADLIAAITNPTEDNDQIVREAVGGGAAAALDEIRRLVCE